MSSLDIICAEIKKVFEIMDDYAIGQIVFTDPSLINLNDIGEFASSVSSKLPFQNWFLCADNNYFVLEKDDKYVITYFDTVPLQNRVDVVVKRCNNEQEYVDMIAMIS